MYTNYWLKLGYQESEYSRFLIFEFYNKGYIYNAYSFYVPIDGFLRVE